MPAALSHSVWKRCFFTVIGAAQLSEQASRHTASLPLYESGGDGFANTPAIARQVGLQTSFSDRVPLSGAQPLKSGALSRSS
jgi:hypothetical protein